MEFGRLRGWAVRNQYEIAMVIPGNPVKLDMAKKQGLPSFRTIAEVIYDKREEEIRAEKEDVLITREEAMNQLGISSTTLWRWDQEKYLCSVKIGALRRYHQRDIDALKDKRGGWR